jgi:hypothetical protein
MQINDFQVRGSFYLQPITYYLLLINYINNSTLPLNTKTTGPQSQIFSKDSSPVLSNSTARWPPFVCTSIRLKPLSLCAKTSAACCNAGAAAIGLIFHAAFIGSYNKAPVILLHEIHIDAFRLLFAVADLFSFFINIDVHYIG